VASAHAWVSTVGAGLWRADDLGDWRREPGVPETARLFSLAADGDLLVAGGEGCMYRRDGARWATLRLPSAGLQPWSLTVSAGTILAGCRPLALLRSDDAGEHWRALEFTLPPGTPEPHTPRVTAILVEADTMWCGVEVGGVFYSEDGGKHWSAVNEGLPSLDIHALARAADALVAATPCGIARYDGRAWSSSALHAPWRYCRALAATEERHGSAGARPSAGGLGSILCGLGDGPPGTRGGVVVSEDGGRSWQSALFPGTAGSTVWSIAAADGQTLAAAIGGEVFSSDDDGRTWARLPQTFQEVRAVLFH
jgi:photosystem II stability/assembly factor-like uncharacterized protein